MLITDQKELEKYSDLHRVWQGIPGIAHTKGGRTFISFYSGDVKETYGNYAVLLKSDNEKDYEQIAVAKKEGQFRVFDPVLWIDPLGRLWFIFNVMPGEQVMASICEDPDAEELVWSEPRQIGRGIMMNKPVVLSTGEWLFPIAIWKLDIYNEFRKSHFRLWHDLRLITSHVVLQVFRHGNVIGEYRRTRGTRPVIDDPAGEFAGSGTPRPSTHTG